MNLNTINNELKSYINEADFNGRRTRNKLIKLINKYFYVDLPRENYKYIDIQIKENGNIVMRDIEYQTEIPIKDKDDLYNRYNLFKEDVLILLEKSQVNFNSINDKNNIRNIIITLLLTFVVIIITIYAIRRLLYGNILGFIWLILLISSYELIPNLKERYREVYIFLKRKIKK